MSTLPEGWESAAIGQIALINPRHPKELDAALQVSFVPMAGLSEQSRTFNFTEQRALGKVRSGFTHFAEGDVLFAKITPCMENGKAAVATGLLNGLGCGTTELHVMRPLGGIDPRYLYHYIHQDSFRREAASNFTGSAGQLRVPVAFIEKVQIPLPPLAEQRRILNEIEGSLSKLDVCQDRLKRIPELLRRFRQAVLAAACSGRLTVDWRAEESTSSWDTVHFGQLVESSFYGPRFSSGNYATTGVPTIRTTDIKFDGSIRLSDPPLVLLSTPELRKYGLEQDDLLVTRTGATIGKCALYDSSLGPAVPSAYLIRFRLKRNQVCPRYSLYLLMGPIGQKYLLEGSTAVAQPNVNATTIAKFPIPLPSLAEQEEIVRRVEALFKLADQIEQRYRKAKAQVDKLTQAILAKAFRGELVPTEAELARREGRDYEPASALLERIRREREDGAGRESPRAKRRPRGTEEQSRAKMDSRRAASDTRSPAPAPRGRKRAAAETPSLFDLSAD